MNSPDRKTNGRKPSGRRKIVQRTALGGGLQNEAKRRGRRIYKTNSRAGGWADAASPLVPRVFTKRSQPRRRWIYKTNPIGRVGRRWEIRTHFRADPAPTNRSRFENPGSRGCHRMSRVFLQNEPDWRVGRPWEIRTHFRSAPAPTKRSQFENPGRRGCRRLSRVFLQNEPDWEGGAALENPNPFSGRSCADKTKPIS